MIIKSLELKNIRSYENETIDFPLGALLFEGDIGSGKSTILLAIEFALFGLGDQKGASLLRIRTNEGSVALKFEVDGKECEVHRSLLRKGKSVHQGEGYIVSIEGKKHLSPTEIKQEILSILNFNEPLAPRAQSVIYRYAVYTPQEEMKAILLARADRRLQTLRKAFGIEDYRTAADNALGLARVVGKKVDFLKGQIQDLNDKKKQVKEKKKAIYENRKTLEELRKQQKELQAKLDQTKAKLENLRASEKKLKKAEGQIPLLSQQVREKDKRIEKLNAESDELKNEVSSEFQPKIDKLSQRERPTAKELDLLVKELKDLREKERELRKIETTIGAKIKDYESIQENKICPTCDRPADPKEFGVKIEAKVKAKVKAFEDVKKCETQIQDIEALLEELKGYNRAQEKIEELKAKVTRNLARVEKNKKETKELIVDRDITQKKLDIAQKELNKLEKVSERIGKLNDLVDGTQNDLTQIVSEVSSAETSIKELKKEVKELGEEIKKKEEQKNLGKKLDEHQIWLKDYFVPTLDNIEKHVMITINQEFNSHFQRWFNLLVDDPGKDARVDEDFTPIIEQDGYEQLVDFLSGGEKTSVALAYRLALNSIVQRVSIGMKSNLLILDEPTDGFSKEQLFKVREILNELKCPQVIMVSHERELESLADHTFRVEKREGISEIKVATE